MQKSTWTFKKLLDTVSYFYSVKSEDIRGSKRRKKITHARHVLCYLVYEKFKKSSSFIGRRLGNRDHTTILYASKKIKLALPDSAELQDDIGRILAFFEQTGQLLVTKAVDKGKLEPKKKTTSILQRSKLSPDQEKRHHDILKKYQSGWSLAGIGKEYQLTRERIRQIVEKALLYDAYERMPSDVVELNFKKLLERTKSKHLIARDRRSGVKKKRPIVKEKEIKWSRYYDHCRKCATTEIKHRSYGYCRRCYPRSEIFKDLQRASRLRNLRKWKKRYNEYVKEYYKRPEVIARMSRKLDLKHFGGNRIKVILRDKERCRRCGLSRKDSYTKYERDLYVLHLGNTKDHRLENLITLCKKCFNEHVFKKMRQPHIERVEAY